MEQLPGGRASALTHATEQLRTSVGSADPPSVDEPMTAAETEVALLGELSAQLLRQLSRRDRLRVRWAVTRGAAVGDQRLAAPAVALAQWHLALSRELAPTRKKWWWSILPPVAFAITLTRLVIGVADPLPMVLFLVALLMPTMAALGLALLSEPRANRGELLNRALLPPVALSPGVKGSAPDDGPTTLEQPCPEKPDAS